MVRNSCRFSIALKVLPRSRNQFRFHHSIFQQAHADAFCRTDDIVVVVVASMSPVSIAAVMSESDGAPLNLDPKLRGPEPSFN